MFIYKVNVQIKKDRENEWFEWMSTKHIPDVLNTGKFIDFAFNKLIPNGTVPLEGYSKYEIDYFCQGQLEYESYKKEFAAKLQNEHQDKFEGAFIADRETYLDVTAQMVALN